jgi:hypothetical protein
MSQNKNRKSNLGLLVFILIVAVGAIVLVNHFFIEGASVNVPHYTATPAPTVAPIANVNLSPNSQIAVLSLNQAPDFKLSISDNGHTVKFPCSVKMCYSVPDIYGSTSTAEYWFLPKYGTYGSEISAMAWVPIVPHIGTVSYYAVVQDSNGNIITSNTVTVQYK